MVRQFRVYYLSWMIIAEILIGILFYNISRSLGFAIDQSIRGAISVVFASVFCFIVLLFMSRATTSNSLDANLLEQWLVSSVPVAVVSLIGVVVVVLLT